MAPVTEHHDTLSDQPLFWRSAEGGEPPVLYLHGVPTSSRRLGAASSSARAGWRPTCRASGAAASAATATSRCAGYDRFVEAFLDHAEVDRVRLVVHDWGAVGLLWAQRLPERVERLVVINAVPLLPGYRWHRVARLWRMRGVGEVADRARRRDGRWRRRAPAGQLADESWPHFDQGTQRAILQLYRASPEDALARAGLDLGAHRLPRARRVGRSRPLPARRRSPRPTRPRSAARPTCCTSPTPGTGPGSTGRMPSIAIAAFLDA